MDVDPFELAVAKSVAGVDQQRPLSAGNEIDHVDLTGLGSDISRREPGRRLGVWTLCYQRLLPGIQMSCRVSPHSSIIWTQYASLPTSAP